MSGRLFRLPARSANLRARLQFEALEQRAMMSAVPAYNSLPGAAKTLYLDFDGDLQAQWVRTDSNQIYQNVIANEYNKDGVAGFNATELNDIREIWQTVADDYAPFNVNVTTVAPAAAAFNTNQAMRVVIGGTYTATLFSPHFIGNVYFPYYFVGGNSFITNDGFRTTGNSGYAAGSSFTNDQPNVVYVFANLVNNWGSTDSEGHTRNLNQVLGTTASHEAGHAFGLEHHTGKDAAGAASNYDVGNSTTTPIMGDNGAADRTIWSKYGQDSVQVLTSTLGARPDDIGDSAASAINVIMLNNSLLYRSSQKFGSASGVISTLTDRDWFHVTSTGGSFQFSVDPVAGGNLDARLELYQRYFDGNYGLYLYALVGSSDPTLTAPFTGVGASLTKTLGAGDFYVMVRSHGGYGDLGQYNLFVSRSDASIFLPPVQVLARQDYVPVPDPGPRYVTSVLTQYATGGNDSAARASDLAFAQPAATTKVAAKVVKELAVDRVFALWG